MVTKIWRRKIQTAARRHDTERERDHKGEDAMGITGIKKK
jgi:hypothetical protein